MYLTVSRASLETLDNTNCILRFGSWEEVHATLRVEGWDGRTLRCREPSDEIFDAWFREGRGYALCCLHCLRFEGACKA